MPCPTMRGAVRRSPVRVTLVDVSTVAAHVVVAAALVRDGRVLLCHRSPRRAWYPDVWDLPGGHVEPGESAYDALARELREELGVTPVDPGRAWKRVRTPAERLQVWRVTAWEGEPVNLAPEEHDEIGWFTPVQVAGMALALPVYEKWFRRL